ncbi:MAG: hypothetical protein KC912_00505 [Proteobacteria bacterium]|nr:hypothetical protein [Pseudomonadota bacterium]
MRLAPLVVLALVGCKETQRTPGAFDTPSALAILEPATGGPFNQPIGYAANTDGGRIAVLALTSGTFLSDDSSSPLARADRLATGEGRRINEIAVYAPEAGHVDLFAADKAYGHLLQIPHVVDVTTEGEPIELQAVATTPVYSNDSLSLTDLVVNQGAASTEDWTITYDGSTWWMSGTRSGRLTVPVTPGEPYTWDKVTDIEGARLKPPVSFTLNGSGEAGDVIAFSTSNGIVEHDVAGTPLHIAMSPDQSTLAAVVSANGASRLLLMDPTAIDTSTPTTLGAGASPGRMAWSADGALFAADNLRPAFWEVRDGVVTEHVLPWPTLDVAPLQSTTGANLAYIVPVSADAVWLYDLDANELRDVNPWVDGAQGMPTQTQVRGIGSIDTPFEWPEEDNGGAPLYGKAVAVSLSSGFVQFIEEDSGCFVRDVRGPRTEVRSQITGGDISTNFSGVDGAASLQGNGTNQRAIQVNACGGSAWTESWRVRYDQTVQAWLVDGSLSGDQQNLAYEDVRYISDNGAVSFLIRSGATPSVDGWSFEFEVESGLLRADGDNDLDNNVDVPLDLPGDPIGFATPVPDELAMGWEFGDPIPFVLVAAEAADLVGRIDVRDGTVTPWW